MRTKCPIRVVSRTSQTSSQVTRSVDRDERSFRRFLDSKWLKALPGKDSDVGAFPLLERYGESGGARVRGVPLEIAVAYWVRECQRGSQTAAALVWACTTETLERRADHDGIEPFQDWPSEERHD
ncbi:MAG: Lipase 3 N-terminal region [Phormidium sp. OSCR]|nr:MAG: Lipase 3 N-terminal region [Phormidium sp. OSCR]